MANQSYSDGRRRRIGRTVTYWNANRKPRPAVITGLSSNGGVVLRVGRYDTDTGTAGIQHITFGNATTGILRKTSRTQANSWSAK